MCFESPNSPYSIWSDSLLQNWFLTLRFILNLFQFRVLNHSWLANILNSKWAIADLDPIVVHLIKLRNVGEVVVYASVDRFVSTNGKDDISDHGFVCIESVVIDCLWWCLHMLPQRQFSFINRLKTKCVRMDSFLFEITYESMWEFGRNCIRNIEGCDKNSLSKADDNPCENTWVSHLHENEKVHSLVLGLLQQVVDPTIIMLKRS